MGRLISLLLVPPSSLFLLLPPFSLSLLHPYLKDVGGGFWGFHGINGSISLGWKQWIFFFLRYMEAVDGWSAFYVLTKATPHDRIRTSRTSFLMCERLDSVVVFARQERPSTDQPNGNDRRLLCNTRVPAVGTVVLPVHDDLDWPRDHLRSQVCHTHQPRHGS